MACPVCHLFYVTHVGKNLKKMMGEEVFQLYVAMSTYTALPISLYKARQDKVDMVFFPCWCPTGSSFFADVQQGRLSLLVQVVVYKFPPSKFCHDNQTTCMATGRKMHKLGK